ncbi:hypothetical protein CAOG_009513 [Capsaspora owczarzaki ATCC 30864]|uniref:Transmembrane protein n=1 Tax=Capsaspora owczarzaki (strain ATCC 30864) TaxID=595528 RepID=A0A0D2X1L7_CAPO3|nr:hypothetical protein CAOG_009513 [Capsaspora owczarzaki ATCC 30864]
MLTNLLSLSVFSRLALRQSWLQSKKVSSLGSPIVLFVSFSFAFVHCVQFDLVLPDLSRLSPCSLPATPFFSFLLFFALVRIALPSTATQDPPTRQVSRSQGDKHPASPISGLFGSIQEGENTTTHTH